MTTKPGEVPNIIGRKVKQAQFGIGVHIGTEVTTGFDVENWAKNKKIEIKATVVPGAIYIEHAKGELIVPFANCKQIALLPL